MHPPVELRWRCHFVDADFDLDSLCELLSCWPAQKDLQHAVEHVCAAEVASGTSAPQQLAHAVPHVRLNTDEHQCTLKRSPP